MDKYRKDGHIFIVRLPKNYTLSDKEPLALAPVEDFNVVQDFTCYIGSGQKRLRNRFRIVIIVDKPEHFIILATNWMDISANEIANTYKKRWQVELLFRFIKQHLNITNLFGESNNAVYGQLFCALIAYVLIHWLYHETRMNWRFINLSLIQFVRNFILKNLPLEVLACICIYLDDLNI